MTFPNPVAWLLGVVVALFGTIWVHELGHYALARLAGIPVTACGVGLSRPLAAFTVRGTRFFWCLVPPMQGLTLIAPPPLPPRAAVVMALTGGILGNACAA